MKHPNQSKLMREARQTLGITSEQMAVAIGLNERPGVAFVSAVEHGKSGMAPHRWRLLKKVVSKDAALAACLQDVKEEWERKYEQT